jgi:peptidylprolyl isomerase
MPQAASGNIVRLHYTGTLDDGSVFDSSRGGEPLEFTVGTGQVIPGFDAAVLGMRVGETKTVTIPAADAYGPVRDEMLVTVTRKQFPPGMELAVGQRFQLGQGRSAVAATVREVQGDRVVLDGNHPLAGQALTFALEIVEIR